VQESISIWLRWLRLQAAAAFVALQNKVAVFLTENTPRSDFECVIFFSDML
jgi:hypothetical protein